MRTCCRLEVVLWIEIAVKKYHSVRANEIQALASSLCAQQKHKCPGIIVEIIDGKEAFLGSDGPVQSLV
jgi:hypothetical protein